MRSGKSCSGGEQLPVRLAGSWLPGWWEDDLHTPDGEGSWGVVQQVGGAPQQALKQRNKLFDVFSLQKHSTTFPNSTRRFRFYNIIIQ